MRLIATMTATNDSALSAKQTASLTTASSSPASAGPITRAVLTRKEFSAIAFGRSDAVIDQMHPERLAQWNVERRHDAEPQGEDDQVPDGDVPRPRERRQHERLQQRQRLRDTERAPAADVVGNDAGKGAEE